MTDPAVQRPGCLVSQQRRHLDLKLGQPTALAADLFGVLMLGYRGRCPGIGAVGWQSCRAGRVAASRCYLLRRRVEVPPNSLPERGSDRESYLQVTSCVDPRVSVRPYLARAVVALVVAGLLIGAVFGVRAALSATGSPVRVAQALAPVAVDGSLNTDPSTVPVGVTAPVSAPPPPQDVVLPSVPTPLTAQRPNGSGPSPGSAAASSGAPSRSPAVDAAPAAQGSVMAAGVSPYSAWAVASSRVIDVPARALQAYGNAQTLVAREQPGCHLSWTTLAGIAHIESNHGRFGGRTLLPDGRPSSPIIGIALDGSPGVQAIRATDGGVLDGVRYGSTRSVRSSSSPPPGRGGKLTATGTVSPIRRTSTTPRWPPDATCAPVVKICPPGRGGGRRFCRTTIRWHMCRTCSPPPTVTPVPRCAEDRSGASVR